MDVLGLPAVVCKMIKEINVGVVFLATKMHVDTAILNCKAKKNKL